MYVETLPTKWHSKIQIFNRPWLDQTLIYKQEMYDFLGGTFSHTFKNYFNCDFMELLWQELDFHGHSLDYWDIERKSSTSVPNGSDGKFVDYITSINQIDKY